MYRLKLVFKLMLLFEAHSYKPSLLSIFEYEVVNGVYLGVPHVIVGDVDISVADAAILEVKADIVIADDIPLDVDLAELGVGSSLGPGHGGVHVSHDQILDRLGLEIKI